MPVVSARGQRRIVASTPTDQANKRYLRNGMWMLNHDGARRRTAVALLAGVTGLPDAHQVRRWQGVGRHWDERCLDARPAGRADKVHPPTLRHEHLQRVVAITGQKG